MRFIVLLLAVLLMIPVVKAQDASSDPVLEPSKPKIINDLMQAGAQVYFLGDQGGMSGWAVIMRGQPQFFYVTPNGSAVLRGFLFDEGGRNITEEQLIALRRRLGPEMHSSTGGIEDLLTKDQRQALLNELQKDESGSTPRSSSTVTPAQKMYQDLMVSNWTQLGSADAPREVFAVIDPDCPHCREFLKEIRPRLEAGEIKINAIPIGLNEESQKRAAMILTVADPMERIFQYIDGDADALAAPEGTNVDGAANNLKTIVKWGFDVTPIIVYKGGAGEIKMIRGEPQDIEGLLQDIAQ